MIGLGNALKAITEGENRSVMIVIILFFSEENNCLFKKEYNFSRSPNGPRGFPCELVGFLNVLAGS